MEVLDIESGQGKVDLFHGRIDHILDDAAKNAGLTKTQYKCWKKEEGIGKRVCAIERSKSRRIKESADEQGNTTKKSGQNMMPGNVE